MELERSILRISDVQLAVLEYVEKHGRATTPEIATALGLPGRNIRYHLSMLVERKLIAAHGEKRGRYYTRAAEAASDETVSSKESVNDAVLADILELGGSVTAEELRNLVSKRGGDPKMIGSLHGRRLAHLTRNGETGRSALTARGREIGEQHLFAKRLSVDRHRNDPGAPDESD